MSSASQTNGIQAGRAHNNDISRRRRVLDLAQLLRLLLRLELLTEALYILCCSKHEPV